MAEIKAKAILKNLDIAPRKVRRVVSVLRGERVEDALAKLMMIPARSSRPLRKLIESAAANAVQQKMDSQKLIIESIKVDEGRTLKRSLPRARGRATLIRKKFSHIQVVLGVKKDLTPSKFILPKKEVKVKAQTTASRPAAKPKEPMEKTKARARSGFFQKVFSRKAI